MLPTRRQFAVALAIVFLNVWPQAQAQSQAYPSKPVRLVIPFVPGGSTDLFGRLVAEPLGRALGQTVIVENKAGAGGSLGATEVARSAPDGYTLGVATVSTMIVLPATRRNPGYTVDSFAPVTNIAQMPNIIAVNPSFPAKNLKELIVVLKANPNKYSFATSGTGSVSHMVGESFRAAAGVNIGHVPYKGSGPAMQDVVGGQVDILVDQLPSSKAFIDSGKLKLLGVVAPDRVAEYPDVMTMEEAGLKGLTDQAWYGIVAPAKVPPAVLAKLSQAMQTVMASPEVRERVNKLGATPVGNSPAEFTAQIHSELEKMRALVKARNISLDE